ncbi:MAG: cytochrome b/b6 domain-containing protein [Bryobacteraceae bacterium]|nr:cytochrome b/b6 domain-containing protein [Bryobacteraceae bacterium]
MKDLKWTNWAGAAVVMLALAGMSGMAQEAAGPVPNSVCADCHETEATLKPSAHGGVSCASCHVGFKEYPHPENAPKPQCAQCHQVITQEFELSVHAAEIRKGNEGAPNCAFCHGESHEIKVAKTPEARKESVDNCGMCHGEALEAFNKSIHGKDVARGVREAPVCTDCHGSHAVGGKSLAASSVSPQKLADTCGHCHGNLKLMQRFGLNANQVTSFNESFHGLAVKAGQQNIADCASCHGYHEILPSTDPESMIHPSNIAATCGSCHPGAGTRFPITRIHEVDPSSQPEVIRYARIFYIWLIPGTIGFMLLHHLGDFIRKMFSLRFRGRLYSTRMLRPAQQTFRMHRSERWLHGLLSLSFILLAYTGFALHYPDEWWSRPVLQWEQGYPLRGTIHRISGIVLVVTGLIHVAMIALNKRLREHWLELIPRVSDAREMVEGTLWRLGLRKERPAVSPHSYVEKAEYWALVWGTAVMAVTGLLLWANNITLQYLPKVWIDFARVIHYYEAVLATLAILVWHFYTVIFDPEIYPMDPAWVTGYSPRQFDDDGHGHGHGHGPEKGAE